MRKRRALFCAALACFICLGISCPASASGVLIDDLPIDPWGELGEILGNGQIEETALKDNKVRFITTSGTFRSGRTKDESVIFAGVKNYKAPYSNYMSAYILDQSSTTATESRNFYISASLGSYIDFWAEVNYADNPGQSLFFTGSSIVKLETFFNQIFVVPDEVQLLINGQPAQYPNGEYYDTCSVSLDGSFDVDFNYPLTDNVTTIGYRFLFTKDHTGAGTYNSSNSAYLYLLMYDQTEVTVADTPATPDPDPDPDNPGGDTEEDEQKGLLKSILSAIANIGQTILDGIKGLFVPDEEDITEIKEKYQTLLEERLGFVYEGYTLLADGFNTIREFHGRRRGVHLPFSRGEAALPGRDPYDHRRTGC